MRLVCLHADTVDALKRLRIQFDDLTPAGLWSSQYHLVGLTPDQFDALEVFRVEVEDITPAQLAQAVGQRTQATAPGVAAGEDRPLAADQPAATQGAAGGQRPAAADRPETPDPGADAASREPARAVGGESEVPLAQARDGDARFGEAKTESKPDAKAGGQPAAQGAAPQSSPLASGPQAQGGQQSSGQKGG